MLEKTVLVGKTLRELSEFMEQWGEPSYRGKQLVEWVYRPVASIEEMTNLPVDLRYRLERETVQHPCIVETIRHSVDGTKKYLISLRDGELVESVFIPETDRNTVCISSQVGCKMGCTFCATGTGGLTRNLTTGEIVDQVLQVALDVGSLPSNIVYMGMGEPLANYAALLRSIEIINATWGLNVGIRQITVSTCGLVPGIDRLAREGLGITLAISLHAADDDKRSRIMPINEYYGLEQLLQALHAYVRSTRRRITVEYALMAGFNDSEDDARQLVRLLRGLLCHVNLIPVNPIRGGEHRRPQVHQVEEFHSILRRGGLEVSIRKERGADIEAACGQLRGQWEES